MPCKIKICGMREQQNILDIAKLGPDYIGFIHYPKSPRFVSDFSLIPFDSLQNIKKVLVTVDEAAESLNSILNTFPFDAVQFCGSETVSDLKTFKQSNPKILILKAFGIDANFDFDLAKWEDLVDMFIFDTKTTKYGGSGINFDWSLLNKYQGKKPYLIAGGIRLELIEEVKLVLRHDSRCHGVDLNSGFETEPGFKDSDRLKIFMGELR